jgi:DNA-directed RNA polymerase I subunit RPA49
VSSELLLQSSDHEKMDFVGREGNEDAADSQIKHYVAVVDPERKTWQVVEARRVKVRGAVRSKKASQEEADSEDEAMVRFSLVLLGRVCANIYIQFSMRAQRTALTNTFGTKQAKKSAQSFAENAQLSNAPDGVVSQAGAALLSSLPADATTGAAKTNNLQAEVQAAKPLPTPDLSASHPSDVYPLETLVPNGHSTLRQLTQIEEWQEQAEQGLAISTVSRFVSNRIGPVVQSGNITQLQVLRLIQLLVEFGRCLKSGGRDAKGSAAPGSKRLPPREDLRRILSSTTGAAKGGKQSTDTAPQDMLPDSVIDAVRRRFAPTGGMVSKHDLTLLHTTICALSLHIPPQPAKDGGSSSLGGNSPNELATDPADLRDDLRLDPNTVYQYFRELGCRIDRPRESEYSKWNIKGGKAEAHARRVARLRVPVEFPKVSRGGRK